jgi:hypothetical protein
VAKSQLDGAILVRAIRNTLAFHPQDQQTAPQSLRKLSRAVEQSADTIFMRSDLANFKIERAGA